MPSASSARAIAQKERIARARSKATLPGELTALADFPETHRLLARNSRTPPPVLAQIAKTDDIAVLRGLARNAATPARTVTSIAKRSPDESTLVALAVRKHLPNGAATALARRRDYNLRRRLVTRSTLPEPAQLILAREPQNFIRRLLVEHASATAETLDQLSRDRDPWFARAAAVHPNVDARTLTRLARHSDPAVHQRVARASATPPAALRRLMDGPNALVRHLVVWRDTCPRSLLLRALDDEDSACVDRAAHLLTERGLTPAVERQLMAATSPWNRNRVAQAGSAAAAGRLAQDPDLLVRIVALGRGRLSPAAAMAAADSPDHAVVLGLLRNPFPMQLDVQLRVSLHADPDMRTRLAARSDCASEVLEALSTDADCLVRLNVALHRRTAAAVLSHLVNDPDQRTRRAARTHRNAKLASVIATSEEEISAVGEARSHRTKSGRQVELASHGDLATRLYLARNRSCCDQAQHILAESCDSEVRMVLGARPHVGSEVLAKLVKVQGDFIVQYVVAGRRSLPSVLRKALAQHASYAVRRIIAQRSDLDDDDFAALATDPSSSVRRPLTLNSRTPAHHLATLIQHTDALIRLRAARHRRADHSVLDQLVGLNSSTDRAIDERATKLSADGRRKLVATSSYVAKNCVARLPRTSAAVLDIAANNEASAWWVLSHRQVGQHTVTRLLDHPSSISREQSVLKVDRLSAERLAAAATDACWTVRKVIAERDDVPAEILELLVRDPEMAVRSAVARNPHVTPAQLTMLAKDPTRKVQGGVARNEATPSQAMEYLAAHGAPAMAVAMHANVTAHGLRALLGSQNHPSYVLAAIARHGQAPPDILAKLADHKDFTVLASVAGNAATPAAILEQLAHGDAWIQSCVAANQSASPDVLARLASADEAHVRAAVAANQNTPVDVLLSLGGDGDAPVRHAVAHNANAPAAERVLAALA